MDNPEKALDGVNNFSDSHLVRMFVPSTYLK
jgi:hypothetical protein